MPARNQWSREQLLVALRLYFRTPFGKLHQHNPEIIELARLIGRSPSAVGMKACNFASLDPVQRARKISALGNSSIADEELWDGFAANPEAVAAEAEAAYEQLIRPAATLAAHAPPAEEPALELPDGPTDVLRSIRARRVQSFFRVAVLASYEYRCALSDIAIPELLNASHIIPWSQNVARRADPRNGIVLNALYDRAFDRGLITFDAQFRVVISRRLHVEDAPALHRSALLELEGKPLRMPYRFAPDEPAMAWHRERVFSG